MRCLVVGARAAPAYVFDDGRDTAHAYCASLRFIPEGENPPKHA